MTTTIRCRCWQRKAVAVTSARASTTAPSRRPAVTGLEPPLQSPGAVEGEQHRRRAGRVAHRSRCKINGLKTARHTARSRSSNLLDRRMSSARYSGGSPLLRRPVSAATIGIVRPTPIARQNELRSATALRIEPLTTRLGVTSSAARSFPGQENIASSSSGLGFIAFDVLNPNSDSGCAIHLGLEVFRHLIRPCNGKSARANGKSASVIATS